MRPRSRPDNPRLQQFLKGVHDPAARAALIANAGQPGADEKVRAWLDQLADPAFPAPADVRHVFKGETGDD